MAKEGRFVQAGRVIDIIATADVAGGDFVNWGTRVGVASADAVTGEGIALQIEGVFEVEAPTALVVAVGDKIFWDGSAITKTVASNKYIGFACSAKAGAVDGTVLVKLGA